MRKFLLLAMLGLVASLGASAQTAVTGLSFTYDLVKYPPCSATVTANCISGFQVAEGDATNQNAVNTLLIPVPAAGATQPTTITSAYVPKFTGLGQYSIIVTPVAKDGKGNVLNGAVAAAAVVNNPPAVGNLKTTP